MGELDKTSQTPEDQTNKPVVVQATWAKTTERVGLRLVTVLGVVAVLLSMPFLIWKILHIPADVAQGGVSIVKEGGAQLAEIAEKFSKGTVTTEFISNATTMQGVTRLQIGNLETDEKFTKTSSASVLWDYITLPDIDAEITAPVSYTFYVEFNGDWRFDWDKTKNKVTVFAPKIEFNTPSINVSEMKSSIKGSAFRFDEESVSDDLKKGIMAIVTARAAGKITLIREMARNQIKEFVQNWLTKTIFGAYPTEQYVEVYFADEAIPDSDEPQPISNTNKALTP